MIKVSTGFRPCPPVTQSDLSERKKAIQITSDSQIAWELAVAREALDVCFAGAEGRERAAGTALRGGAPRPALEIDQPARANRHLDSPCRWPGESWKAGSRVAAYQSDTFCWRYE